MMDLESVVYFIVLTSYSTPVAASSGTATGTVGGDGGVKGGMIGAEVRLR